MPLGTGDPAFRKNICIPYCNYSFLRITEFVQIPVAKQKTPQNLTVSGNLRRFSF
jgi:hypothetical protein